MQSWRRILYFVLLNVFVSALTTWAVVTIVLRNQSSQAAEPIEVLIIEPVAMRMIERKITASML